MTTRSCDVLVIGLGPAGASAAAAASRGGSRVIAIERKEQIGVPVQCAEFIPRPMGRYARSAGVLQQHINGMRSHLPSGRVAQNVFPGLMIDRAAFDQALAMAASEAGGELLLSSVLRALDADSHRAWVETPQGEVELSYRALIAADGPYSEVAQCLGLPRLKTANTRQYSVPLLREYSYTDIWLSDAYPGGYAWLFPKGTQANLGLGIDQDFSDDIKAALDELHRQLQEEGTVGGEILNRTGGPIPVGGPRERLVAGNVLFVGDAAGLTHPVTGAGIGAAVVSGELAGQACVDWLSGEAHALAEFEEEIRDQFAETICRALSARERMERVWHTPAAREDAVYRRGWIAFPEYFA